MVTAVIIAVLLIIAVVLAVKFDLFVSPQRRAGRRGEKAAADLIKTVLREGDHHFTNVQFSYDKRRAELDNVIVNQYGVFIIEVKNYDGRLVGSADDFEWQKYHTTGAGNVYVKTVKNPIRQVKRQVYLLARHLESHGTRVWVNGYALLLRGNSHVADETILTGVRDIDRAIHTPGKNKLSQSTVSAIVKLLS